ncbi:hypothetical protein [Pelagicoccus sp. SDUM812003]|uniref:hypothetical protein n=1 Tax=Pelagicoccus sp. SDUM812003 TaxID=3041267 RepID=UPI00280E781F|nr:hypothetical protein [Pelagicoccus sp. SDUM812003]MDQ8205764.1 hypothetical protein [Pelagicoccus sp. SDUM812003]
MKRHLATFSTILLAFMLFGCATRLSTLAHNGSEIAIGDVFTIPTDSVLFMNRGYIDSINPTAKKISQLRDGTDFDGYSEKPKVEILAGTEVTIHKIYKTQKGRVYVTALLDGEKVDVTRFFRTADESE